MATSPPSVFFLPLLLLLVIVPISGRPKPYQTLHVGPLPPLDDLAFLPSSLDEEDETSSVRLPLFHIDFLLRRSLPNATAESLLRLRLLRDGLRASSFNSSVVSGLAHGSGEYFTRVGIGSPPSPSLLVLDTGSDVVWTQCSPCSRCYPQSDPLFAPSHSSSFSPLPCSSPLCRRLDESACHPSRRSCLYRVSYGDGSSTSGDFSTDTFTFRGHLRIPQIAFGCGRDNQGLFVAASGLLGLGRGPLSFPSQAARSLPRRTFSYCLVDRTSSVSANRRRRLSSTLIFGSSASPNSPTFYTPMLANPKLDTFYYVALNAISVGGTRIPTPDLLLDPSTGTGGVIVDSGTSVTRLARPSYVAVRDAFRRGTRGLPIAPGFSLFDTCYDLGGRTVVKVPTLALHFRRAYSRRGEVAVSLPAENYMIPVDTNGVFCFALAGTDSGISILGNIQQQGFRVVFDVDNRRVGFAPRSC